MKTMPQSLLPHVAERDIEDTAKSYSGKNGMHKKRSLTSFAFIAMLLFMVLSGKAYGWGTTSLGNGTDPGAATLAPGGAATMADAFTFVTSGSNDSVTAVVVTLAAGTSAGLSLVEITNSAGTTVYGSVANPASDTPSISLGTPISVTGTTTTYKIRVTPKSHANMPAPAGSTYSVTARISSWTCSNSKGGSDTAGTTVTVDNLSPGNVTAATATGGASSQVPLAWTNPADGDLNSIIVLRRTTSVVTDVPVEGSTYVVGDPIGSSTVACVVSAPTASCADTGLVNGTAYYYKIFAKDSRGNYSATGVVPTGSPATPVLDATAPSAVTLSTGTISDTSVQLNWTSPGDDAGSGTATTYDIRYSTSAIDAGNFAAATTVSGEPAPLIAGTAQSYTVTGLSPLTTYYFAMKTGDEVVNWSTVSNSPSAVTLSSDAIPPADTIDLVVTASTTSSLTVSWTSPGDDGSSGTATTYDIRYSTSPITSGNWASATAATGEPAPLVAGTAQSLNITGLAAGTTYYIAMKTSDSVPNTSGLSNNAIGTTNFNGTTATLHPSGDNALDGATYTGATAPTALDTKDDNTTYGSSAGTGNDYYLDMDDPSLSGTISSVQIKIYAARDDTFGSASFTVGLRMGGTNYLGGAQSSGNGTYALYSGSVYNTNPNSTVAWTWTDINNLIGVVDHTDTTGMRVTELYAEVVYTPGDLTAPAAVTLSTSTITDTTIKLTWTAPGDDASTGTASTYDIRYSTSAINAGNWASATKVSGEPAPAVAGTTTENYTVTGLTPNTTYYFAIKTADEVPNWSAVSNSPSATTLERPVGGYTADNVIPAAQVTQATDGTGLMTITWKGRDGQAQNVTLKTFEYSIDGDSSWSAPTNGDASAALSANWNNNGSSWTTATTFGAASAHSFTFNTKHANVTGINSTDQSDIRVRFTLTDSSGIDSTLPATSENFRVDDLSPTSTIVSAIYEAASDKMTITGTNFLTIAAAATDIKSYVDWTKFVWDINGDNAVTANISFVVGDVTSLTITDDTTLTLQFSGAKGTAIEATAGYSMTGGADTLDVTAGFIKDYYGNAATTDVVANAPLATMSISGTVYENDETTAIAAGSTVRLLVNGASAGTAVTDGSGAYTIWASAAAGDAILAYVDGDAAHLGATVSIAGSVSIAGFNIYSDHVVTRHDNAGSLTNANMSTAKGAYVDTDILYSVSGSALTVSGSATELHIPAGKTFAPGGDVTTPSMNTVGTFTGGSGSITVNGNLTNSGTFTATSGTTTVSVNFNNNGTFTASGGTVTLNGTNQGLSGSTTFNNLNKTVAAADTLYFTAGSTTTVNGTATLQGASGQLLSLQSTVPTTYWNFTLGAASTKAISYVSVTDSDASGSNAAKIPVNPTYSTSGGHNVSWFGPPSLTFLKTVAVTSDPVNGATNPKNIPGAEVLYTLRVTNSGASGVDNNTLVITDPIPTNTEVFTGDLSGGAPLIFVDGTPSSALSCAFIAPGDPTDCMDFSSDGGSTWTKVPNGSFDPDVTNIRFSISGAMNPDTGSGSPYFNLNFRVRVK